MAKVSLSIRDRFEISNLIPKSGSLEEVRKYKGWLDSLEMTEEELEKEKAVNELKDKKEIDKAINALFNVQAQFDLNEELLAYLKDNISSRDKDKIISVTDNIDLIDKLINA